MLKKMLGIDPAEIKRQVDDLAKAAAGVHSEQHRIAELQNLLAQNVLRQNGRLEAIAVDIERLAALGRSVYDQAQHQTCRLEAVQHDLKNMLEGMVSIYELLQDKRDVQDNAPVCGEGVQDEPGRFVAKPHGPKRLEESEHDAAVCKHGAAAAAGIAASGCPYAEDMGSQYECPGD